MFTREYRFLSSSRKTCPCFHEVKIAIANSTHSTQNSPLGVNPIVIDSPATNITAISSESLEEGQISDDEDEYENVDFEQRTSKFSSFFVDVPIIDYMCGFQNNHES